MSFPIFSTIKKVITIASSAFIVLSIAPSTWAAALGSQFIFIINESGFMSG